MSDLILSIFVTGPSDHPRYLVADPESNFWTGENWTDEESEARLYASVNDAGRAIQDILLAEHGHSPCTDSLPRSTSICMPTLT